MPQWVKNAIECWTEFAGITSGLILRQVNKAGRVVENGLSSKVIWNIVRRAGAKCAIPGVAPHDLRRYAEYRIMPNSLLDGAMASPLAADHAA
jgi:hypothetical protein